MTDTRVYTLAEVTEILKVTRRTIYNYIKAGQLKAVKIGREWRVTQKALDAFLEHGTEDGFFDQVAPPSQLKTTRQQKRSSSKG